MFLSDCLTKQARTNEPAFEEPISRRHGLLKARAPAIERAQNWDVGTSSSLRDVEAISSLVKFLPISQFRESF